MVTSSGVILTAGHVAPNIGDVRRISFADGHCAPAKTIFVMPEYDLSLLKILCSTCNAGGKGKGKGKGAANGRKKAAPSVIAGHTFPTVTVVDESTRLRPKNKLVCVGQPGRARASRLEATVGRITAVPKDPMADQSELGALEHDCKSNTACSRTRACMCGFPFI